jgi:arylsulfatase A-like enzyme/Flp pilus assembly protein TadD
MLGVALAVAAASCRGRPREVAHEGPRPNLLFVTIDTLRADRVGAYGHARADTATLDGLARQGVLLEDAVVAVAQTRPSHVSLFTGRQPYEHGLRDNFSPALDPSHATLATELKRHGYATGGFIGAYPVSRDSGLDRGFDTFDDPFSGPGGGLRLERSSRRAALVVDKALAWLEGTKARPFFAWVHVFDPHAPYDPPPPFRERFAGDRYDGEVAYADSQIGRLTAWLERSGEAARTLVVVTSDHGEGLGEHGEDEHGLLVYDSTLRVPLVVSWPGQLPAGTRVKGQFRSLDLLPTLLELMALPALPTSGASRAVNLREGGRIPDNEAYAESLYGELHFGWAPLRALRAEGLKYVSAPRAELFDLRDDPGETRNRIAERPQLASAMGQRLGGYDTLRQVSAPASVDPQAVERLAALGYVGGPFFTGTPSGIDPKDAIGEYQAFHRRTTEAARLFEARDYAGVVRVLSPGETGPPGRTVHSSFTASYYKGSALLELGRFEEAIGPLQEAVRLSPATASGYVPLVRAQAAAGRIGDAEATAARGLSVAPRHPGLLRVNARLLIGRGATQPALAALEQARDLAPEDPFLRVDLANLLRMERPREALVEADAAVRLAPDAPEAHLARGLCLGALGRHGEAAAAFRTVLRLAPRHPVAGRLLAQASRAAGMSTP